MTGMPPHADVASLETELGAIMNRYRRAQTSGGGLDDLVQRLLTMMREHGLHLPTELTVLLTTLGMVDGTATQIDPLVQARGHGAAVHAQAHPAASRAGEDIQGHAALRESLCAPLRPPAGAADARSPAGGGGGVIGFSFLIGRPGLSRAEEVGYRIVPFVTLVSVAWFLISLTRVELRKRREDKHPSD